MRVVVCFDVDGTLETSGGPVKTEWVRALMRDPDVSVWIVSQSQSAPPDVPRCLAPSGNRLDSLNTARDGARAAGLPVLLLYVSDNNDRDLASAAGFTYVDRNDFRPPA